MNHTKSLVILAAVGLAALFSFARAQDAAGTRFEGAKSVVVVLPNAGNGNARHAVYNFERREVSVVEFGQDGVPRVAAVRDYYHVVKVAPTAPTTPPVP